jgi:hypothetical protein
MSVPPEVPRCWTADNKIIFVSKALAEEALPAFRRAYGGKGKVFKCWPHDHFHLTKDQKGRRRTRRETRR